MTPGPQGGKGKHHRIQGDIRIHTQHRHTLHPTQSNPTVTFLDNHPPPLKCHKETTPRAAKKAARTTSWSNTKS